MNSKVGSIVLLFVLLLASCSSITPTPQPEVVNASPVPTVIPSPSPILVKDQHGREFSFAQAAQRIISLAPANTEILFAVGAGKQVVGRDSFSDFPQEALSVKDIGGGFGALDTETILSSKPDLILASELTPAEQVQALEDLGLSVFILGNPTDLPGMYENLRTVARMTGHPGEAETLIGSLQARVAAVEQKLAGITDRPLVMYELDGTDPNAPWVPGPDTFINTLLKMAGADNMSASLEGVWVQVSLEKIIERDPDMILLGDSTWGGVTTELVSARGGWDALTAVKCKTVFPFDDNLVSRPGPRLVDGLEALAKLFHPDLFK